MTIDAKKSSFKWLITFKDERLFNSNSLINFSFFDKSLWISWCSSYMGDTIKVNETSSSVTSLIKLTCNNLCCGV